MSYLDVWYARISAADAAASFPKTAKKSFERGAQKATHRDHLQALAKMTTVVEGEVRIVDDPPIIIHHSDDLVGDHLPAMADAYRSSLHDEISALLNRYAFVDFAQKAVGVGSVGTRCYVVLMQGSHDQDPLFLQIKEAGPSALEPFTARSRYGNHGQRVVPDPPPLTFRRGQRVFLLGVNRLRSQLLRVRHLWAHVWLVPEPWPGDPPGLAIVSVLTRGVEPSLDPRGGTFPGSGSGTVGTALTETASAIASTKDGGDSGQVTTLQTRAGRAIRCCRRSHCRAGARCRCLPPGESGERTFGRWPHAGD